MNSDQPVDLWSLLDDKPHEECGVFGIYAPGEDVARITFFGLYALQHRGQESAGIATADGQTVHRRTHLGLVSQAFTFDPKVPSYAGGKFPLSTYLAQQVRKMLADPARRAALPEQVRDWLSLQKDVSMLPRQSR